MARRITYIHELAETRHRQGLLLGRMAAMGLHEQDEANLRSLTDEVVKSSEIEGERLDAEPVRSSLAKSSQDTAARDIQELVELGLLARGPGGGRSTHYVLRCGESGVPAEG